jgi:sulfoxide reductase catalytic subunit YedY
LKKLKHSDVTPENYYINRRNLIAGSTIFSTMIASGLINNEAEASVSQLNPNSFQEITNYNNFYEFGTSKTVAAKYSEKLTTSPWRLEVDGLTNKKGVFELEKLLNNIPLEERIYRLRCVEGWSMVIPWIGFPLKNLINQMDPKNEARYVAFETLYRPEEMRGQRYKILDWPYVEGLTIEEAMNPLTFLATGLYGKELPNQNGAPLRLVVPWKYGFKSIKSIVKISFTSKQPKTTWSAANPREYGFFSNVNPNVDHPRWSQATERVIGEGLFGKRRRTEMFNGYQKEVAYLYKGMDLEKYY